MFIKSVINNCRYAAVILGAVVLAFLFPNNSAASETSLMMDSESGDYIGGGSFRFYSIKNGGFYAWKNHNNGVSISFHSSDTKQFWSLDFSAPNNALLSARNYPNATRFPFQETGVAGMDINGDGRGCNQLTGNFRVKEISYGSDNTITSFWATFEQHCEGDQPALRGEIRYNAAAPDSVTSIISSSNPSVVGQLITFTSKTAGVGGTPTGSVTFMDGQKILGTAALSGTPATATFTTSRLSARLHYVSAEYNGDSNYDPSVSAALRQSVEKPGSTMLMTNSDKWDYVGNGLLHIYSLFDSSFRADRNYYNGISISTESVDGEHLWSLDFAAPDGEPVKIGSYPAATRYPLQGPGEAGLSIVGDSRGCSQLTGSFEVREIIYGADDAIESFWATFEQHCEGTAPALTGDIRIKANVPEIKATISSSSNPSSFGQPVTFSSVVTGSAGTPTGQVAFVEGSLTDGARIIGTDILSGSPASSKITRSGLNTGMHSLKAVYLGDAGFPSFSSYALNQNVTKARTNTNIKSSENTVKFGEPVVFTATVTGASGAPKGFVIFKDGSSVLGTVALSGNPSVAAFTTSSLSAGIHSITAVYEGGLNYYTSVSNSLFQFVSIWP